MAGYIRDDVTNQIANGNTVDAVPLDGEFNAIQSAFASVGGHSHNGAVGEGAPITMIGPTQDVVASANSLIPKTDNTLDLGSSSFEWKDLWVDGTANIDSLVADTADINGGTIDATVIGGVTPAAVTATNLTATNLVATNATVGGVNVTTASNTQTLTNKTINLANNTLVATSAQLAASVTDETGSGALVFASSPALSGVPTAPTAAPNTNTTQIATTAHVFAERSNTATLTNKTLTSPTINGGTITDITDLAVTDKIVHAGDVDTAIRFPAVDTVTVDTAGVERLRITSAGRVGINTTNPTAELDVNGNMQLVGASTNSRFIEVGAGRTGDGTSYVDLIGDTTYPDWGSRWIRGEGANGVTQLQHRGTGDLRLSTSESANIVLQTATTTRFTLSTTALTTTLPHLSASGTAVAPTYSFFDDTNTGIYRIAEDTLGISTGGVERVRVTASGAQITGLLSGTAVTQSDTDVTANRLLRTGAGPAQAYRQGNILGTVSQSGGVPTGRVIERGSNANGEFVRFADGTQICWRSGFTLTQANASRMSATWTYPAAFSSSTVSPVVSFRGAGVNTGGWTDNDLAIAKGENPSATSVFVSLFRSGAATPTFAVGDTALVDIIATGRWF